MVEIFYGGLMAHGSLPDVSYVISLGSQTRTSYPFKSSMYELIRKYHELDAYSTHFILSKFCNQAHMWVDCCNGISRVWAID